MSPDFTFIQITDHHLREHESDLTFGFSPAYAFRSTLRHITQHAPQPDFIVSTGDLVHAGTAAEYATARAMLGLRADSAPPGPQGVTAEGLRDMPMYFLPGNHDPRDVFFQSMFAHGAAPATGGPRRMNVEFSHKGMRLICIDWGEENMPVASPAMFDFLVSSLQDRSPAILLMHHALAPVGIPYLDRYLPAELPRLEALLRGSSVRAMFCGHFHTTYQTIIAGIPLYGLRSTTFSFAQEGDKVLFVLRPPHYRVVTVSENAVTTEIVEVDL